ncbi:hypothetical protein B0J11DRAFT_295742 [Dendryphion nanum]|uniref:Uncharacterized protein n=1 Tax=Dendryphion nanum TaxID=256645 RepID=A0A9P9DXZ4_9PLEO|nr:hypothetical protein B0J11DRAFT_295742 [Dendryphion nanum]
MPSVAEGDYLVNLTSAPIFDNALYHSEALNLPDGQNEDDLNAQLALLACESGIEDPYRYLTPETPNLSTAMSMITLCSEERSSVSIHSRETQSTGMTSHPSRTSKDHTDGEHLPVQQPPPTARKSSLVDDYGSVMDRTRPSVRHMHSSSTASHTTSLVSNASSLLNPPAQKHKRASGLFSLFRKDSRSCTSKSHSHHGNPQTPKLECGHILSKQAVRRHIQDALEKKTRVVPTCCGKPLPRAVLATVLTKREVDVVTLAALPSPDIASLQHSGCSEDGMSQVDILPALHAHAHAQTPGSSTIAQTASSQDIGPMDEERLNLALANEAFKILKTQQKEQFERVSRFEACQRRALSGYHSWPRNRLTRKLESAKEEMSKEHAAELECLDESQILAELDMRKVHDIEAKNAATALKHMEAYCSGSNPGNPDVVHAVTEDDRGKLARQRRLLEKLPAKQDSAINVLRARQEKDTNLRRLKQQAELQQLDADYERDKRAAEELHLKESSRLDKIIESRRQRLTHRWDLKFEIWRRDWESQHGNPLPGRFPHEQWPVPADPNTPVDSSSTLALYTDEKV